MCLVICVFIVLVSMKYGMKKILDIEMKNQFRYLLQEILHV